MNSVKSFSILGIVVTILTVTLAPLTFASPLTITTSSKPGQSRLFAAQTVDEDLSAEFPSGIELITLVQNVVEHAPSSPSIFRLDRITLGAKWEGDEMNAQGPMLFVVESGNLIVMDELGIEGTYPPDTQLVVPMGAIFSIRNDGSDNVSILRLSWLPVDAARATPVTDLDVKNENRFPATPVALASPLPTEASIEPLLQANINEAISSPVQLLLIRATWSPGSELPEHVFSGPVGFLGEEGTLNVAGPSGIEGQITPGKGVMFPAGLPNRARNVTDEPAVILMAGMRNIDEPLIVGSESNTTSSTPSASNDSGNLDSDGSIEPSSVPMYRGNAAHTGEMAGPGPSGSPTIQWQKNLGGVVISSAAVSGETVFVGSFLGKSLFAFDATTGETKWQFKAQGGIRSSPAVSNGTVYFGSTDFNVYAVDAETGELRWKFTAKHEINSSPTILNDTVFITSGDRMLYALDASDGTERWRFELESISDSSPAVDSGLVFAVSKSGVVYAVDASTGSERWRFDADADVVAAPVVANGSLLVSTVGGVVHALDVANGDEEWRFETPYGVVAPPSASKGTVIVATTKGIVHALDGATGEERWRYATGLSSRLASSIVGDTVYVSSTVADVFAVDLETGSEQWRFETDDTTAEFSPTTFSSPTIMNGIVYVGTISGTLYAIGGDSGTFAVTPTPSPISEGSTVEVIAEGATLRAAPSPTGVVVAELPLGTKLTVVGPSERRNGKTWWEVESSVDGTTGYISDDYLRVSG